FLRYLGRHSLQVFVWSIFLSYVAFSFKQPWHSLSPVWKILFVLGSTLSLVLPAWVHEHWQRTAAVRNSIPRLSPTVAPSFPDPLFNRSGGEVRSTSAVLKELIICKVRHYPPLAGSGIFER